MPANRETVAVWFDLPAADFERCVTFYEALLGVPLRREAAGPRSMAVFPYTDRGIGGAIMHEPDHRPGTDGPVVYLNADGQLDAIAERLESLGGAQLGPKVTLPGDMGAFIHIRDTEGNRIGLHAVR